MFIGKAGIIVTYGKRATQILDDGISKRKSSVKKRVGVYFKEQGFRDRVYWKKGMIKKSIYGR